MRKPILLGVLLSLFWVGCRGPGPAKGNGKPDDAGLPGLVVIPQDSPKLQQIRVEEVRLKQVPKDEVVSPCRLELNPNRFSRVSLPVAGRIAQVTVRLGDAIKAGQPLLNIESPEAEAAMSTYLQAEGTITQAKASLVKTEADHDRAVDLFEHNAIARKEVLSAENALTQAKASLEQAQAAREQALRRLTLMGLKPGEFGQKVEVRSPISGKVLEIGVVPGEYRNDTTTPVMTIADLATVWVSSNVPESYIRFIQLGEQVEISLLAYPAEKFSARVRRIADTVDPQTRTVKVQAELDNAAGRLRPEMYGSVRHTAAMQEVVAVPAVAVIQGGDRALVFVEHGPGRFQRTPVKVGKRSGELLPVESGLKPGERIVVDGAMLLDQ